MILRHFLATLVVLLGLLTPANAAVTVDTFTSTALHTTGGTTLTTTYTMGSVSNGAIELGIMCAASTMPTVTSVSFNGVAMTPVPGTATGTQGGVSSAGIWYGLLAPASGAHTLQISWTGSTECTMVGISFAGVDQTSIAVAFPNGGFTPQNTTVATPLTITTTSATGDIVVAGGIQNCDFWGAISGSTIATNTTGPATGEAFSFSSGAATVTSTMALMGGGTCQWLIMANDVKATGGGGPTPGSSNLTTTGVGAF